VRAARCSSITARRFRSPSTVESIGFPTLSLWLTLDQPDTDIAAFLYLIKPDVTSEMLGLDMLRARYRKSVREPVLVTTGAVERYDFKGFASVARRFAQGSCLRLAIGPVNSKYYVKNYNSGGVVAEESYKDARTVTATLHHDAKRPSALYVPIAPVDQR
jgi:uncharacterized protein